MSCYIRIDPPSGVTPWINRVSGVRLTAIKCNMCEKMRPVEYFTIAKYRMDGTPVQRVGCHFCLNRHHAHRVIMRPVLETLTGQALLEAVTHER